MQKHVAWRRRFVCDTGLPFKLPYLETPVCTMPTNIPYTAVCNWGVHVPEVMWREKWSHSMRQFIDTFRNQLLHCNEITQWHRQRHFPLNNPPPGNSSSRKLPQPIHSPNRLLRKLPQAFLLVASWAPQPMGCLLICFSMYDFTCFVCLCSPVLPLWRNK